MELDDTPASKRPGLGDGLRRLLDERAEERTTPGSQTAVLNHRGRRHVVRVVNISKLGAMVAFNGELSDGEEVELQLLDHGSVAGQVRWIGEGRAGIHFTSPLEQM